MKLPFDLKEEQRNIILAAAAKAHVLGILPTGFGKCECYGLCRFCPLDEVNIYVYFVFLILNNNTRDLMLIRNSRQFIGIYVYITEVSR